MDFRCSGVVGFDAGRAWCRLNLCGDLGVARIEPIDQDQAQGARRKALAQVVAAHGRATNMKRTLARSPVALRSLMTWYDLRDEAVTFLGQRATPLFAHAISAQTDCLICSTF